MPPIASPSLPVLLDVTIHAGFPNPAEEAHGFALDLNRHVVRHPASTFYVRVEGDSMEGAGILSGDLVAVDRSLQYRHNDIVVGTVDGEFTLKRLVLRDQQAWLVAANPNYPPIPLHQAGEAQIWGVVTHVIRELR